ncbi:MAG: response regulator [Gemmatimonadetes bacterium]|nr:response regulator [Gemmatimonadota bacterium]
MEHRILAAEDSATQAEHLRVLLEGAGYSVEVARSGEQALERLESASFDLVLTDVMMPGINGFELCARIKRLRPDLPVILLTSLADPMDIVRGLEAGGDNYITKPYDPDHLLARLRRVLDNRKLRQSVRTSMGVNITFLGNTFTITSEKEQILDLLLSSVEDTVRTNRELEARQQELTDAHARLEMYATEQAREARRSTERYRVLMQNAGDAIFVLDRSGKIVEANERAAALLGRGVGQLLYQPLGAFMDAADAEAIIDGASQTPDGLPEERRLVRPDGEVAWVEVSTSVTRLDEETFILAIARDLTQRKRNEEALRRSEEELGHSQRLDAIGRLSGGIAHDFNNVLTAIQGSTQLLMMEFPEDGPVYDELREIDREAARAAALTRQLLAFSRKQVFQPRVLDLNAEILDMERMLGRLAGENVELRVELDPDLGRIRADASQVHQVVMNLAVNARDAMPDGGVLLIATRNVDAVDGPDSGEGVLLTVRDTGTGIPEDVREKIFEPFFSTKGAKGTGLGLSTVYGIVRQSGGSIRVDSAPAEGTTFEIRLPRVDGAAEPVDKPSPSDAVEGSETILIVEDEAAVRKLAVRILRKYGYTALDAATGEEALELLRARSTPVDLLVTDLMMPGMGGAELAAAAAERFPDIPVLYMSGYTDETIVEQGILKQGIWLLEKPFTPEGFVRRIREVLGAAGR